MYQHIDLLGEKKKKSTALNYNIKWNSIIVWELNNRSFTAYTATIGWWLHLCTLIDKMTNISKFTFLRYILRSKIIPDHSHYPRRPMREVVTPIPFQIQKTRWNNTHTRLSLLDYMQAVKSKLTLSPCVTKNLLTTYYVSGMCGICQSIS